MTAYGEAGVDVGPLLLGLVRADKSVSLISEGRPPIRHLGTRPMAVHNLRTDNCMAYFVTPQ
jgi:hypothetical protein